MSGIQQLLLGGSPAGYQIERSLRFNSADSAYLNRTPASAGNLRTWTWSAWVKRSKLGDSVVRLFNANDSGSPFLQTSLRFDTDQLRFYNDANSTADVKSSAVYRDASAWYHIVCAIDTTQATAANRVKLYVNGSQVTALATATYPNQNTDMYVNAARAHQIGSSVAPSQYFDGYLTEINFIDGQALTPSDFGETDSATGVWKPKKFSGTYGTNGFYLPFSDNSSTTALGYDFSASTYSQNLRSSGTNIGNLTAGGGLAAAFDGNTNQGYAASASIATSNSGYNNTVGKDWGSGVTKTITAYAVYGRNDDPMFGGGATGIKLQGSNDNSNWTDLHTGTTPTAVAGSFIVTSGITTSTAYRYHRINIQGNGGNSIGVAELQLYEAGTYGINNWTPNLFSVTAGAGNDSLVDTPTSYGVDTGVGGEVRGNYITFNQLLNGLNYNSGSSILNGNLQATTNSQLYKSAFLSMGITSGKWYCEFTWTAIGANAGAYVGIAQGSGEPQTVLRDATYPYIGSTANSYGYRGYDGQLQGPNDLTASYGNSYVTNDIIGVALDMDSGKVWFSKNGTWQNSGSPTGGTNAAKTGLTDIVFIGASYYDTNDSVYVNTGQRPFAYTAPSGFKALCTQNLPTPTIGATSTTQANRYMDAKLWAGNGSTQSISSYSFAPDFAWIKSRGDAQGPVLYDTARPVGNYLMSNATDKEESLYSMFTAWNSDGFSLSTTGGNNTNGSTRTYVGWAWKANGTGVSNTSGTITSTVSANTTAGFSIVTYTGNGTTGTVGHGLGVTPSMIIVKSRSVAQRWTVFHTSTSNAYIYLNETFGSDTANANVRFGNNTSVVQPTSTLFTIGSSADVNQGTTTYVAYCFVAVAGYSAFGSYSGNNSSTDGPFVYLGFRPRFIMIKSTSAGTDWVMMDTTRNTYNLADTSLYANSANSESTIGTVNDIDFLSNGFKLRNNTGFVNASQTYIYAAFAEAPFKYSLAR